MMRQYKNPFDIKRTELLDQLARMRINFFHTAPTATMLQDQGKFYYTVLGIELQSWPNVNGRRMLKQF